MDIKNYWENRVELPKRDADKIKRTTAVVENIDEYENVCNIRFTSDDKRDYFLENVPVKILHEDDQWFPKVGEEVDIEYSTRNNPIILCKHIYDYVLDVRGKKYDFTDLYAIMQCYGGFHGC